MFDPEVGEEIIYSGSLFIQFQLNNVSDKKRWKHLTVGRQLDNQINHGTSLDKNHETQCK